MRNVYRPEECVDCGAALTNREKSITGPRCTSCAENRAPLQPGKIVWPQKGDLIPGGEKDEEEEP